MLTINHIHITHIQTFIRLWWCWIQNRVSIFCPAVRCAQHNIIVSLSHLVQCMVSFCCILSFSSSYFSYEFSVGMDWLVFFLSRYTQTSTNTFPFSAQQSISIRLYPLWFFSNWPNVCMCMFCVRKYGCLSMAHT